MNFEASTWDDTVVNGLEEIQLYVLQVPFFLMSLMRYVTPALDNMHGPLGSLFRLVPN